MISFRIILITIGLISQYGLINGQSSNSPYYGTFIGKLDTTLHNVAGDVFAVDETTIFIKSFSYDGTAPDAYFWAGTTTNPDVTGFIVPDEKGSTKPLGAYTNKDIVLRLPEGKTFRDIKWFSVWCRKFKANFGHINILRNLVIPTPVEIRPLSQLEHGVKSGPITIVDAQTFLITDFHYDGQGPAGYWWATPGQRQSSSGLRLKDENGSDKPLRRYSGETVVISLPEGKTIWDFDWIGVWCEEFQVDFGNTRIPQNIRVPPSPKMLGIKPESKLNCEVLYDQLGFELRWVMDGDDIVMQLVGKIDANEYMAFGLSKDDSKSNMIGADAVVTWFDSNGKGHAVDYYLGSKEQCVGTVGSCPDLKHSGASDSITLLHAAIVNGFSLVTFKRPQLGVDDSYDQHVYSDGNQAIIWAIGPLNDRDEVSYHRLKSRGNVFIDFARTPKWNCPNSEASSTSTSGSSSSGSRSSSSSRTPSSVTSSPSSSSAGSSQRQPSRIPSAYPPRTPKPQSTSSSVSQAWDIPPVICPSDYTFRAQIGPTGGKKGYQAITGKVGWGISWYINGLIIPELTVERGKTYTFIVEGGNDKVHSSRRHPLYITDSPEGGFDHKTEEERRRERIFAGVGITKHGELVPTAEGRLCEWKIDTRQKETPEDFADFFDFQRTLSLQCSSGEPGILRWRPDANTPDVVYYQCYTHRYLGWRIRVVNSCDQLASASITRYYHTLADNSTSTSSGRSRNTQDLHTRSRSDKKQKKSSNNRRAPLNSNKNDLVRTKSKQSSEETGLESTRFRQRKPVLAYANPYQSYPRLPNFVTPSLPFLYPTVATSPVPFLPIGQMRPLELNSVRPASKPTFIRQRLPPPIPPTSSRSYGYRPTFKLTSTTAKIRNKVTSEPSPTSMSVTIASPATTKHPTTTTTTTTTQTTTTTTPRPTSEIGLAENLHGGFLPVLINSKGPTLGTTERPRTTSFGVTYLDEATNSTSSNETSTSDQKSSNQFNDTSNGWSPSLITSLISPSPSAYYNPSQYVSSPSIGNGTGSNGGRFEYFDYRPTSDQDKWEDILLDLPKPNSKISSSLEDLIMSGISGSGHPEVIEKGLTGSPLNSNQQPIVLPTSTVPISSIFSSPMLPSQPSSTMEFPFFSSIYSGHFGLPFAPITSSHISNLETTTASTGTTITTESTSEESEGPVDLPFDSVVNLSSSIGNSSDTDDAILSHIMSLIADNAAPPEVKIISKTDGTVSSTHVEVHHNLSKRSAHHETDHSADVTPNDHHHHGQLNEVKKNSSGNLRTDALTILLSIMGLLLINFNRVI